ncbi:transcriptional regulator, TetR family [Loktanella fryxellensis]|uniref:Transcriptional regulator, TetR family n=1 Tax=Loktanella fryxellensis TaxID=245187 RepID=A0A1H8CCG4_9RHOB|nr:TetR/AcrR family transcriptional regulator [Loktanella fryxellensis]SEM92124.1 transcriptional regulator, TetR family [Loktanella fryxellensis]
MAAVEVSLRNGYDAVTTEAIAAEAGISTRTFFNYYPNKQAAILGERIMLLPDDPIWFTASHRPVIDDVVDLLDQALRDDEPDRRMLNKIMAMIDSHPALHDLFRTKMDDVASALTGLLVARLGADFATESRLLGDLATLALTDAVSRWAVDDNMTIDDITALLRRSLLGVGRLLQPAVGDMVATDGR